MTLLLAVATRSMAYGFYVGGVQITSSNYTDIIGAIKNADADRITVLSGGSITYVPASKTLTLKNVSITRTGGQNRGITNDSETNLKVIFEGTVKLDAQDASPILCKANTTLKCANGGKVELYSSKSDGLTANNGCTITIQDADMTITANSKLGIMSDNNNGNVYIYDSKVTVTGKTGAVGQLKDLWIMNASTVTFNGNSSAVTVHDLQGFLLGEPDMQISSPTGAHFDSSKMAIVTSSYPNGYKGTIKFTHTALPVNSTNFPDNNFRSYISSNVDINGDGYLTSGERLKTAMDISQKSIHDLTGIQHFPALEYLDCSLNSINELTLSGFENLNTLNCVNCGLKKLYLYLTNLTNLNCIGNNLSVQPVDRYTTPNLETIACAQNTISKMDLRGLTKLKEVNCYLNMMTSLNASGCTNLTTLDCGSNLLTSLDVTGCTNLTTLSCGNNQLTELNISACSALTDIKCDHNNIWLSSFKYDLYTHNNGTLNLLAAFDPDEQNVATLDDINVVQNKGWAVKVYYGNNWYNVNNGMININSTNFPNNNFRTYLKSQNYGSDSYLSYKEILGINSINVDNQSISNLTGIKYFIKLQSLYCSGNSLSALDISNNTKLKYLYCNNNALTSLDVTKNVYLEELECSHNNLTSLKVNASDITSNTSLSYLICNYNALTSLDLTKNKALEELECSHNNLTSLKVTREKNNLRSVVCDNNKLSASAVETVLSVYGTSNCSIVVQDRASNTEQNVFNATLLALAEDNNWTPYYLDSENVPHEYDEYSFVTGIDAATAQEETTDGDALRYNLQGQRVGKDYRGVVIVNGRKLRSTATPKR